MNKNEQHAKTYLQRISNFLLINGGFLDNSGLYTGEIGLVLFFFCYARYTQNNLFREFSFKLIEKIQNSIHQETPINYKNGLAGIGATIEYLVQEGFVEANTDDILEEFDDRIFSTSSIPRMSFEEVISVAYYAIWRIHGSHTKKYLLLNTILPQVLNAIKEWCKNCGVSHSVIFHFSETIEMESSISLSDKPFDSHVWFSLFDKYYPNISLTNQYICLLGDMPGNDIFSQTPLNMGLVNGLAGSGMTLLTELNGDFTWTTLLKNNFIPIKNEPIPF